MPDTADLLARLVEQKVDLVVVGGFAAAAHGASLVTQDIDVCCDFSSRNLMRLQTALFDLHPVHRITPARLPLHLTRKTCTTFKNLYLDTDFGQLDCLSSIDGIGSFREVKRQSIAISLPLGTCRILSIDALIRAKEAMSRPRDREAVRQLKAIRERRTTEA
jgi:hypothetical protein